MSEKTFYDIHMHAFNLSHPYFGAFAKRFKWSMILTFVPIGAFVITVVTHIPVLSSFLGAWLTRKKNQLLNLLAVLENDIGSFFLLMENCLRENGMLDAEGLHIGGKTYSKCILTPLMIDFGYKGIIDDAIHYKEPSRKPIRDQVVDVFNAIKYYAKFVYSNEFLAAFPNLGSINGQPTSQVFRIYPFIGINTKHYNKEKLQQLLKKYFGDYQGQEHHLASNIGKFDGNIDKLKSNFAAGIKVYPPMGFDPWPEDNETEMNKVRYLYQFCQDRRIPITVHGGSGGFVAIANKDTLKKITSPAKWEKVLSEFPRIKLNIAHLPLNEKFLWVIPKRKRLHNVLKLIMNHENVYADFSCRATDNKYYKSLETLIENSGEKSEKMASRILFGTDFPVNLTSFDSYNSYLKLFSDTPELSEDFKEKFCSENPERFLFSEIAE